ncbi:MAG: alpha/beta fold hydrolase [Acidobacteria bacterium]|nr:alpha/beta fold hydrolase [Acidobacteriota bacterium]
MLPEEALDLVAWSYGAMVTLNYALDRPERVRTLTLIEPPAFWVLEATGQMDDLSRREREDLERLHKEMVADVTETQLARFVRLAALAPPGTRPEGLVPSH